MSDRPAPGTYSARDTLKSFYSLSLFKCSKVSCEYFIQGFTTASERDSHSRWNARPFKCDIAGCDFSKIGFEHASALAKLVSLCSDYKSALGALSNLQMSSVPEDVPEEDIHDDRCWEAI